jgi:hypothetical protein
MKSLEGTLLEEQLQDESTTISPTTVAKKYRVQLDFSPKDFREVESLVEELGLNTRAELFRSALVALRWMVQKKRAGCTIVALTPENRYLEPVFEFLQGIQSPATSPAVEERAT